MNLQKQSLGVHGISSGNLWIHGKFMALWEIYDVGTLWLGKFLPENVCFLALCE